MVSIKSEIYQKFAFLPPEVDFFRIWARGIPTKGKIKQFGVCTAGGGNFFNHSEAIHTAILLVFKIGGLPPAVGGTLGPAGGDSAGENQEVPPWWGGDSFGEKIRGVPPPVGGTFWMVGGHLGGTGWDNPPHLETAYVHPYTRRGSYLECGGVLSSMSRYGRLQCDR